MDKEEERIYNWIHEDVTKPTNNDVLFGRGGGVNRHAGNVYFRKLVSQHEMDYRTTSRKYEKTDISARIVALIRRLDPPGRFLKQVAVDSSTVSSNGAGGDGANGTEGGSGGGRALVWRDVGDEKARNKTSQALRERGPSSQQVQQQLLNSMPQAQQQHPGAGVSLVSDVIEKDYERATKLAELKSIASTSAGLQKSNLHRDISPEDPLRILCVKNEGNNEWSCISTPSIISKKRGSESENSIAFHLENVLSSRPQKRLSISNDSYSASYGNSHSTMARDGYPNGANLEAAVNAVQRIKENFKNIERKPFENDINMVTTTGSAVFRQNISYPYEYSTNVTQSEKSSTLVRKVTDISLSELSCESRGSEAGVSIKSNNSGAVSTEEAAGIDALLQLARCGMV